MRAEQVVDLVNTTMTYKPGWDFRATVNPYDAGRVTITYEFWADNSSPRYLDDRPRVIADGAFDVMAEGHDWTNVQRQILEGIIGDAETHESREFLRFNGEAPFHPHRSDGVALYAATERVPMGRRA